MRIAYHRSHTFDVLVDLQPQTAVRCWNMCCFAQAAADELEAARTHALILHIYLDSARV